MNRLVLSGALLALLAGGAIAQSAPPVPPATPGVGAPGAQPLASPVAGRADPAVGRMQPPPPPPGGPMVDDAEPMGPGGPPDGPRGHRPPPPPPSRAAHIQLERGDTSLDLKCADDEPMRACADIAMQLLDKMQGMPASATPAP